MWTKKEIKILKNQYKKQEPIINLVKILNYKYSHGSILQKAIKLKIVKRKPQQKWTFKEIETLKIDWINLSKDEICKKWDRKYSSIETMAHKLKIKKPKKFLYHEKLKILLNNSNNSWYWLGFIIADGFISQGGELKIVLARKDSNHLQKLSTYLNSNLIIKNKNYTKNGICLTSCKDAINGKEIIKKFNIKGSKTYIPCNLNCIKTIEQFLCFLIGFIDGDGHLAISKLTGVPQMIRIQCYRTWIDNFIFFQKILLDKFKINSKAYIDTQNYARFCIYRKNFISKIYSYVKYLNIPYMERKWDQYKGYTINLSDADKLLLNESVQ